TGAEAVDARADVYALGAMLYEMITGELPFDGPSSFAIATRRLWEAPPDPRRIRSETPASLANLVLSCMAQEPADRPAGAAVVRTALAEIPKSTGHVRHPPPIVSVSNVVLDPHAKAVAVLPLKNLGPPEDAYLAEGLTDDLIDRLSAARALRVRSRGALDT